MALLERLWTKQKREEGSGREESKKRFSLRKPAMKEVIREAEDPIPHTNKPYLPYRTNSFRSVELSMFLTPGLSEGDMYCYVLLVGPILHFSGRFGKAPNSE